MIELGSLPLTHDTAHVEVRKKVHQLCLALGYSPIEATRLAVAVSGLGRDAFRADTGARLQVCLADYKSRRALELVVVARSSPSPQSWTDSFFDGVQGGGGGADGHLHLFRWLPSSDRVLDETGLGTLRALIETRSREELMSELQGTNRRLEEHQTHLEETIAQRTAELQVAVKRADAANQAKSTFLASMSHEIRTPMNAVINMTELALESELSPRQQQYLSIVSSSARNLLSLINDILDFSKIEAEKVDIESAPFQLSTVLDELTETFRAKVLEKHVELIVHVALDVPDALVGDALRVRQVLTNLIGNAFKFTDKGEVSLRVSLVPQPSEGASAPAKAVDLLFAVRDSGIGIPQEHQKRLFQPFTQADSSTSRKYGGTGLGLVISKRLARLMDGELSFESEAGHGTTFFFSARFGRQDQPQIFAATAPEGLRSRKVLIVEDTESSRELLEALFQRYSIPCTCVGTAEQGLELLRQRNGPGGQDPFGLVLLDWLLPGMNGLDAAAEIRAHPETRALPIILMSAYAGKVEEARCVEIGVNVFLPKPITSSSLYDAIIETWEGHVPAARKESRVHLESEFHDVRVLLAEDNEANQFVAQELLTRLGIEVAIAENGRKALEMVERERFAAVLMDMQMPEMDGLEATRRIRDNPALSDLPVIAMTANAMKADIAACFDAGMNDFLSKPIDRAAMLHTLRRWLPHSEIGEPAAQTAPSDPAVSASAGGEGSPALEGIDVEDTVRRLSISFESLRPMFLRFAVGQRKTLEDLGAAVTAGDGEAARRYAHALAGAAVNLGANGLHKAAKTLELAARDENSNLGDMFSDVRRHADVVFHSIESLRSQPRTDSGPTGTAAVGRQQAPLHAHLERLQVALTDFNFSSSTEVLQEVMQLNLPEDVRRQAVRLQELVDNYELYEAGEIVTQLIAGLAEEPSS